VLDEYERTDEHGDDEDEPDCDAARQQQQTTIGVRYLLHARRRKLKVGFMGRFGSVEVGPELSDRLVALALRT
jgi:hypothetical protein